MYIASVTPYNTILHYYFKRRAVLNQPLSVNLTAQSPKHKLQQIVGISGQHDILVLNYSEWPIFPDLQLFQSFPTEVAQNDSEWPIFPDLQLFQSFPTEVAQNDSEWPILPNSQLFQSFLTEVAQNDWE